MDVSLNGALHVMHHEFSNVIKQEKQVIDNIYIFGEVVRHLLQYCAAK
jgi:hypothetical protein